MKVLHVLDHSLPVQDGYAFRSREILRFSAGAGVSTAQMTSAKHGRSESACETVDGVDYHRTQPSTTALHRLPLMDQWGVVSTLKRRLAEVIREESPDILHVHSPALNGIAAVWAARRFNLPLLYEVRSLWEDAAVDKGACQEGDLRYRVTRALETWVVRRADQVVCICEGLRGEMAARGLRPDQLSVVPNAVDVQRFSEVPRRDGELAARLGLAEGATLGFIGSFFGFEGLHVLVSAMSEILAARPDARLLLVGGGPEDQRVRALAADLGLSDRVVFTGRVPHAEVERYYGLVDVFVYPRVAMRITELVTPLKPLEAMANRRLVVASDVGGHREMVTHGETGLLFRAGDAHDLASRCVELLGATDRWAALRENGRRYVERERSWQRNIERYLDIYRRLSSRPAGVRAQAVQEQG